MNKKIESSIAIVLFLLVGCAAPGPKLANSAEDIAGTWQSTLTSVEMQFNEDGTYLALGFPSGNIFDGEFRFEGTRLILKMLDPGSACVLIGDPTSIYEVELLENGNLKFTAIEDTCTTRVAILQGGLVEVEWEPVP